MRFLLQKKDHFMVLELMTRCKLDNKILIWILVNYTQSFKRVFLETTFSKSVRKKSLERLNESLPNFNQLFLT